MGKNKKENQQKAQVKKYPFSEKKDLYVPTENEIAEIRIRIPDFTFENPQWHILRDIMKKDGYTEAEYKNMTLSEVVDISHRRWVKFLKQMRKQRSERLQRQTKYSYSDKPETQKYEVTVKDTADMLDVTSGRVTQLCEKGELVSRGKGKNRRLDGFSVLNYLKNKMIKKRNRKYRKLGEDAEKDAREIARDEKDQNRNLV